MKNSTLVYTLIALGFITWLFVIATKVMLIISAVILGFYLVVCLQDIISDDNDFPEYNIFSIITKALDSLPPFIKKKDLEK
jgi:hypothetical protein